MRYAAVALALVVTACGSSSSSSSSSGFGSSGGVDKGGFGNGDGSSSGSLGGKGPSPTSADGCSEAAKLVYVVSEENDLYSFQPDKLVFTKIGTLKCPSGSSPNSMAIDRSGTAWVNYSDGALFKVSTTDASCQSTPFQAGQSGFVKFGMAFAANAAGSQDETLYVAGIVDGFGGKGLAKIDLSTFKLTPIGDFSGQLQGQGAELTGTGDAKLYGFFTTFPDATLAQIDKGTGGTSGDKDLSGVSTGNAWAFSFWGGDFWFYTSDGLTPSRVTRLQTSGDNSVKVAKDDVGGFTIVGAGVSTCAPTTPPR